jgi:putative membrane protein
VWRTLGIFPLARLQSVGMHQGPIARALGAASVHAHTIAGRVSGELRGVGRDDAVRLFADAETAAIAAAAGDRSHRWGVEVVDVAEPGPGPGVAPAEPTPADPTPAPGAEPPAAPVAEPSTAPVAKSLAAEPPGAEPTAGPDAEPTAGPGGEPTPDENRNPGRESMQRGDSPPESRFSPEGGDR